MADPLPGPNADLEALRRFAAVRLIVADLDGTLFPSELAITAQRLLRQLDRAGVHLTVATGRTLCGVRHLLLKLQGDPRKPLIKRGTPLILYNGSVVVDAVTGRLLRRNTLAKRSLRLILEAARGHSCELFAYIFEQDELSTDISSGREERVLGWQFELQGASRSAHEFNGLAIEWQAEQAWSTDALPCAILLRSPRARALSALATELKTIDGVSVTKSGTTYLELRPQHSNKGVALEWAAQHLALPSEQVLAVGDNDNDIEMLEWAGIGVAVSTASMLAQTHADFLCQLGPFQGVVEVLRLVHQARRYFRTPVPRTA